MIRRLLNPFSAFAAVVLVASCLIAALYSPASADTQAQSCKTYDDGVGTAKICLIVNYSGHSVTLVRTQVTGDLSLFESKVEDCDNLRLWNDNDVVVWRKDDAQCDLTKADPVDTWYPGNTMPQSSQGHLGWTFYPKINNGPDPGYTHISLVVTF